MNIVEAYIKFKGQLVILVSGISGSGISHLAKNISKDLNIPSVSYAKFCKKNYNEKVKLPDGTEIINWDTDDVIDWDNFNREIEDKKKTGVVAYNQSFSTNRLSKNLEVDAHINIKLSKQNLFTRRQKYIENHKDECQKLYGRPQETLIFNRFTFPYYLQSVENSKITKFINANEFSNLPEPEYDEKLANEAFSYLMNMVSKWIDKYHQNIQGSSQMVTTSKKFKKKQKQEEDEDDLDEDDELFDLDDEGYSIM